MNSQNPTNNFTVSIRLRPSRPNTYQAQQQKQIDYKILNKQTLLISNPTSSSYATYGHQKNRKFQCNKIFEQQSNSKIFKQIVEPKLNVLDQNFNLTVFTYGVTGSGKTYTVFGDKNQQQQGLAFLAFSKILQKKRKLSIKFTFTYMQIYNEQVNDLLYNPQLLSDNKLKSLQIMEDMDGNIQIPDLTKIQINTVQEIIALIQRGNSLRACSSNMINKMSSRSHAILQLNIEGQQNNSCMTVIDLAGSQKIPMSISKGQNHNTLQKQGSNINKSLLSLANCIKCLQQNKNAHIPYRDSKLTRILKSDLSGKAHNIMIACIGRQLSQIQETLNTLQYAMKARKIQVELKKNESEYSKLYNCKFCGQKILWQKILKEAPYNLNSKHINKNNGLNDAINVETKLMNLMKQFKDLVMKTITYEFQLNGLNYQNTQRSTSSRLFSYSDDTTNKNKLVRSIDFKLIDNFYFFQNRFKDLIKDAQNYKNQPIQQKLNKQSKKQIFEQKAQLYDKNVNTQIPMRRRNRIRSQNNIKSKQNKKSHKIDYQQQQTQYQQQETDCFHKQPYFHLQLQNITQQKEALLSSQVKKSSNLRRRISIRPKKVNSTNHTFIDPKFKSDPQTANTTALDYGSTTRNNFFIEQSFSNSNLLEEKKWNSPLILSPTQLEEWLKNQKSHKMNPDVDSEQQDIQVTNKQAIIRKLMSAKNRYGIEYRFEGYNKQVEVSSFQLDSC